MRIAIVDVVCPRCGAKRRGLVDLDTNLTIRHDGCYEVRGSNCVELDMLVFYWKSDTQFISSMSVMENHPAYRQIIAMGAKALPFIFSCLRQQPDWWFVALMAITGADPVPVDARGDLPKMTESWLEWAREHGY